MTAGIKPGHRSVVPAPQSRRTVTVQSQLGESLAQSIHSSGSRLEAPEPARGKAAGSQHGTTNRYWKYGCRCKPCVKAARDYQRKWKERNPLYHPIYGMFYRSLP